MAKSWYLIMYYKIAIIYPLFLWEAQLSTGALKGWDIFDLWLEYYTDFKSNYCLVYLMINVSS